MKSTWLCSGHTSFSHTAVETLGPMNTATSSFFAELRQKISAMFGDDRESSYLFGGH